MFKPAFRKHVEPLIPKFLMRWMDPFHSALNDRLRAAATSVPAGALVLDAGAGAVVVNIGQGREELAQVAAEEVGRLNYIVPVWSTAAR